MSLPAFVTLTPEVDERVMAPKPAAKDKFTGEELWKAFQDARVPAANLKALGHDLYFARSAPSKDGAAAILPLSGAIEIEPRFAWAAMNIDPGRSLLEKLATDYQQDKPWKDLSETTRAYFVRIAERITIIKRAQKGPQP